MNFVGMRVVPAILAENFVDGVTTQTGDAPASDVTCERHLKKKKEFVHF